MELLLRHMTLEAQCSMVFRHETLTSRTLTTTQRLNVTVVTSSSRPGSPSAGEIIYETDTTLYFGWNGSAWTGIGGSSGGAGLQDVFFLMGA